MDFMYQPVERYRAIMALLFKIQGEAKRRPMEDNTLSRSGEIQETCA